RGGGRPPARPSGPTGGRGRVCPLVAARRSRYAFRCLPRARRCGGADFCRRAAVTRTRLPVSRAGQLWSHLARSVRWQPIVAGAALAGAVGRFASHADATMLALLAALGASFVLDDPAAVTLASSPSTLWWRRRVCLAFVLPLV